MSNLSYFWYWLLLSIIVLTWFWHILLLLTILVLITAFLCVKNKSSRLRLVWFVVWSLVWLVTVSYSLVWSDANYNLEQLDTITLQVSQQVKPDTMVGHILSWSQVTNSRILIQWDNMQYTPWTFVTSIVSNVTIASYPVIQRNPEISWHPSSFDYWRWLAMKWFEWHIVVNSHMAAPVWRSLSNTSTPRNIKLSNAIHLQIQEKYTKRSASLLEGMILWWRAWLTALEYTSFVQSWLVHIIAVSGSNIMMVVIGISFLLFWMPLYLRVPLLILSIILYSVLVWLDSSVQRALVMWSTMLLTLLAWRRISIRRSLWYACILLVVFNPWTLLYDLWFLLSFWALLWILYMSRSVSSFKIHSIITSYVLPSLWATMGVLPILVVAMDWINILSPLINIIIIPFVPLILFLGLFWLLVPFPFVRIVEQLVSLFFDLALRASEYAIMLEVSTTLSKIIFVLLLMVSYRMYIILIENSRSIQIRA